MSTHTIVLEDEQLILLVELLAVNANNISLFEEGLSLPMRQYAHLLKKEFVTTLRTLLQESLKDPRFRRAFNDHFEHHPIQSMRERAWPWISENLVWE